MQDLYKSADLEKRREKDRIMEDRIVRMNKNTNLLQLEEYMYPLVDVATPNVFRNLFPFRDGDQHVHAAIISLLPADLLHGSGDHLPRR